MEKKKMKMWKKILIIVVIIVLLFLIYTMYRYMVITKIQNMTKENKEKTNLYYYSETDNVMMEFWRKDNIKKLNMKQKEGEGDLTFWMDENTDNRYMFINTSKTYVTKSLLDVEALPMSMLSYESSSLTRFIMSITTFIMPVKYNDTSCYYIKTGGLTEKIEKDTGMLLYSYNEYERKVNYSFDTVTDDDVKLPDIEQYELKD